MTCKVGSEEQENVSARSAPFGSAQGRLSSARPVMDEERSLHYASQPSNRKLDGRKNVGLLRSG